MVWKHLTIILLIFQLQDSEGNWASKTEDDVKTKLLEYGYSSSLIESYLAERKEMIDTAAAVSQEKTADAVQCVYSIDRLLASSPSPDLSELEAAKAAKNALASAGFSKPLRIGLVKARMHIETRRRQLRTSHREQGEHSGMGAGTSNAEFRQDTTKPRTSRRKGLKLLKKIAKSLRKGT